MTCMIPSEENETNIYEKLEKMSAMKETTRILWRNLAAKNQIHMENPSSLKEIIFRLRYQGRSSQGKTAGELLQSGTGAYAECWGRESWQHCKNWKTAMETEARWVSTNGVWRKEEHWWLCKVLGEWEAYLPGCQLYFQCRTQKQAHIWIS